MERPPVTAWREPTGFLVSGTRLWLTNRKLHSLEKGSIRPGGKFVRAGRCRAGGRFALHGWGKKFAGTKPE
jgi:hypothetical protein